ncbi:hypothetical protein JCM8097_004119 [Rhodosporidiobolus ruineniae]
MDLVPHIYHEKQEPGSMLCGQHALNNLLQTSLFTPQDLADIARQLDAMEAAQLDPGTRLRGENAWEGSQNYDDSGFFSVQVMEEALKVLGLRLVRWGSKEMSHVHNTPEAVEAFLLNHQLHWFSIRRFATPDRFYNLDSCIPQPSWISATYLGLTLREAENQGYSIFAVIPSPDSQSASLPPCPAADKALNLPPPHGNGAFASSSSAAAFNPFGGNGHSLSSAGGSSFAAAVGFAPPAPGPSRQPFSSALNPSLSSSYYTGTSSSTSSSASSSRKGKRPASDEEDDDDDIIIEEPQPSHGAGGEGRRQRRRLDGPEVGQGGAGAGGMEQSEEEMMAAAIRESLRVSQDGGGGGSGGSGGTSAGSSVGEQTLSSSAQRPSLSRAAASEEAELARAIQASLAHAQESGVEVEVDEDDHDAQEDSPSMEELRRRRLARFGA